MAGVATGVPNGYLAPYGSMLLTMGWSESWADVGAADLATSTEQSSQHQKMSRRDAILLPELPSNVR